jgi:hypothetical protein
MPVPVRSPYPDLDDRVSRGILTQLDEAAPCAEHWKIPITAGGVGGDYPVSATIMSECASRHDRGQTVALVFSMQGADLVIGPLVAIGLLKT